jgi:glycosyltransferase involved in cell wall biosynthesis
MKLLFFTPVSRQSAIGRMAALVTGELLRAGIDVEIIATETHPDLNGNLHHFGAPVISWKETAGVQRAISSSDACVYHIGNSFEFHEGSLNWLEESPGIVCLHDFFLGHLFYAWADKNREQAHRILRIWYGADTEQEFFSHPDGDSFIAGTHQTSPMTEWVTSQAIGTIAHSAWGCDRVLAACSGPVQVVPLAYDPPTGLTDLPATEVPANRVRLTTIGHINSNKRVEDVITAISRSQELKDKIDYRLVGAIEPDIRNSLTQLARESGVQLKILGQVDDNDLAQAFADSDIISCLRWPALEGASASATEAMLSGKCTLVTDTGFYSDIPDECTVKVQPDNHVDNIRAALEDLSLDREKIQSIGDSARNWSTATFTAANYAEQLIEMVNRVAGTSPVQRAIADMSATYQQWSDNQDLLNTPQLIDPLKIFE